MRRLFFTATFMTLVVIALPAIDAVGTIRKVDPENNVLVIERAGQVATTRVDKDVRVLDSAGKPLPGGLTSPDLKPGTEVTVTTHLGSELRP